MPCQLIIADASQTFTGCQALLKALFLLSHLIWGGGAGEALTTILLLAACLKGGPWSTQGLNNCPRPHTQSTVKVDLEPKWLSYTAKAVITQPCHFSASKWGELENGYIPYTGPWINPIILRLGNWKQGHSNIDPTPFLSSGAFIISTIKYV